jgi:potassium efflux system protein
MSRSLVLALVAWLAASGLADRRAEADESPAPASVETQLTPDASSESVDSAESAGETEPPAAPALEPPDPARRQAIEARLKALDDAGLSDDDKKRAVELYQQAIKSFDVAAQQIEAARKFESELARTQTGKQSTADTAAKLAAPLPPYEDVTGETLAEVEQRAELLEASLALYREELAAMLAAPKRRSQRMAELPKQISETQQKLKQADEELAALAGEDAADAVAAARRGSLELRQVELKATLYALEAEQKLYEQTSDWVTVRRDYFARYVPHKEKRLAQLRDVINRLREQEAQQEARLAAAAAEIERPKAIRDLAVDNKELAEERSTVAARMAAITDERDAAKTEYTTLKQKFASSQQQAGELSYLGGQLLRDQQAKLPNVSALRRQRAARESTHSEMLLRIYDLYDQSSELANLDELTDRIAARSDALSAEVRAEVRQLLAAKRETLERLIKDYEEYSRSLSELHGEATKLIELVEEYGDFIAERVLWIRSCSPPARADWNHALAAVAWSLDPHNWRDVGESMLRSVRRDAAQYALTCLGLVALVAAQRPARRRLREYGAEARRRNCTKLAPTIYAVGLTAILALPWPALLALAGWSLDSLNEHEFVRGLGAAIQFTAVCLLLIEISRHLCRPGGLADAHFDWPDACLRHTQRKLRWLVMLGLPPVLWLVGLETQTIEPSWSSSLGRALFVAVMLLLAATLHRLLLAKASPFRQITLIGRGSWLAPIQIVWRPASALLPAALAVLATVGYYYTAQQAAVRILQTVAMLLAVLALGGVTRRWLLVSRRRLAREQAKQRRAQLAAAADDDPGSLQAADLVDDAVDLAALSEQTQKLVRTFLAITMAVGLVLIWGQILPALKYPAKHLLPGAEVLTWGHLAAFVFVLAVTYIAVRDVPALLELLILQHLPLDSGSRYAFTTMTRYALTAVGLTAAFNSVEAEWAKIQWLVAAMSVGLGFGLQEIFANFVSGIILLFERPIRVGDVVTLGDKTGVVNRIRMRSTTIVDPDRKEYIVPNKDLVTERLLNWTLTDYTNRVEVIANVASNTDTDLACSLLLEAVREQPHVLREPAPTATFEGFSETGLKLALRCFLPNLDNRGSTIHGLHTAVDRKFRAAGIEGAYGDMRIRVTRDSAAAAAALAAKPDATRRKTEADRHEAA